MDTDPISINQHGAVRVIGGTPRKDSTSQYERVIHADKRGSAYSWTARKVAISFTPTASMLDVSSLDATSNLTEDESNIVINQFFTDEDGAQIDIDLECQSITAIPLARTASSSSRSMSDRLSRAASTISLRRTPTIESTFFPFVMPDISGVALPLSRLIRLITQHQSLQRVEIPAAEGYQETSSGFVHRFLVLELRRAGKDPVWLRMDRRPDWRVGALQFVLASSTSPASDTATFSARKEDLICEATRESRQEFETISTLREFRYILQIICDELVEYQLWPANCWFFVSLLQQHLQGDEAGCFVDGSTKWGNTARHIRSRVHARLRAVYHMPEPLNTENILLSLQRDPGLQPDLQGYISRVLKTLSERAAGDGAATIASPTAVIQRSEILRRVVIQLLEFNRIAEAVWIGQQAVNILRELHTQLPRWRHRIPTVTIAKPLLRWLAESPQTSLSMCLNTYGIALRAGGRSADACGVHREHLQAKRDNNFWFYPDRGAWNLAVGLNNYCNSLRDSRQYEDACSAGQEAVSLMRELSKANPGKNLAHLAQHLHNYGRSLHDAGELVNACRVLQEAVSLRRELFRADPDNHRAVLASSLHHLSRSLYAVGRFSSACAEAKDAVGHWRHLRKSQPDDGHTRWLIVCLKHVIQCLEADDHGDDALAIKNELSELETV